MADEYAGGEAGIRTLGRAFRPYNGLANRRLQPLGHLTYRANYCRTRTCRFQTFDPDRRSCSIVPEMSLSRRQNAWRPREGRSRSRYCIARTRSESCAPSSASRRAQECPRGRDCERRFDRSRGAHGPDIQLRPRCPKRYTEALDGPARAVKHARADDLELPLEILGDRFLLLKLSLPKMPSGPHQPLAEQSRYP